MHEADRLRGIFTTRDSAMAFISEIMKNESSSIKEYGNEYFIVTQELNPPYTLPEGRK